MTHTRCALLCAIKIGELCAPDSSHSGGLHYQVPHRRLSQEQGPPPKSLCRHWGSQERHGGAERNAEERGQNPTRSRSPWGPGLSHPLQPAAGWPGSSRKRVGKQGRRAAGQPQPDLAWQIGNCKVLLRGAGRRGRGRGGGEAFSLFRWRACLNSLAESSLPGTCLYLPARLCQSQPQGLLCSIVSCTPHPSPRIKITAPLPTAAALHTRVTQAGGLHLLLICRPNQ